MSFDVTSARKTIVSLQAHRYHPGGEVMVRAAELLNEAIADAASTMAAVRNAEAAELKAKRENEGALLEIKDLRARVALCDEAVATLKQVAAAKKGAGKIAETFLAEKSLITPSVV